MMSVIETFDNKQINEAWQLQMFRYSLKKQQKMRALLSMIGETDGKKCLLITCGDNNGAMNWYFKQHGGDWSWADAEPDFTQQIGEVTGDEVVTFDKRDPQLPFEDDEFDLLVTIDVHEHLQNPELLNQELFRLVSSVGRVYVTTPNGEKDKLATRIKKLVGMGPEQYGHYVIGYEIPQLREQLDEVGFIPVEDSSYSRFFTEMVELGINFVYVKLLSSRGTTGAKTGQISPQTRSQVKSVEKTLKFYKFIYPLISLISKLDFLDRSPQGYAVIVEARKW